MNLVLIADPGQDLDDEMAFVMVKHLVEERLAVVKGVVITLAPAYDRARLIRGTFELLGLLGVPIGFGSEGGSTQTEEDAFIDWAKPYMVPRYSAAADNLMPARFLLRAIYSAADDKSLTFVVMASLKDPAIFLRDADDLFEAKTREVVIMGGVEPWEGQKGGFGLFTDAIGATMSKMPSLSAKRSHGSAVETTVLIPDSNNYNMVDMEAANYFFRRCQEMCLPLVVVTRYPAQSSKLPPSCYDELASTGSWIGCRVRNAQRESIEALWARACAPRGSHLRGTLPESCDRNWFLRTFCGSNRAVGRGPDDSVWDLVEGFMQYDTMATLAAIPSLREKLFAPIVVQGVNEVQHRIIGKSESEHNVVSPSALIEFLFNGFKAGLAYKHHRNKVQTILLLQPRWYNHAETLVVCLVLRAVCDLDICDCAGIVIQPAPGEIDPIEKRQEDVDKILRQVGLSHVHVSVAGSSGTDQLLEFYERVSPAGMTLVVAASLDYAADFAEAHPTLFVQKTQKVIVVGGGIRVPGQDENGRPTDSMMVEPDPRAQNFVADMPSAKRFFHTVQKLLVPMVTVSREFAQVVRIPRNFYDSLGGSRCGGSVGKWLYEVQRQNTVEFWKAVCSKDEATRRNLPESLDRQWFVDTFCSGCSPASDSDDDVWQSVKYFHVYNAQAILLALEPVLNRFVRGNSLTVRHVTHKIVGNGEQNPDVVEADVFQGLILQCMVTGTRLNESSFDLEPPTAIQLEADGKEWTYDTRPDALDWLLQ